jgi:hypothetical protein
MRFTEMRLVLNEFIVSLDERCFQIRLEGLELPALGFCC